MILKRCALLKCRWNFSELNGRIGWVHDPIESTRYIKYAASVLIFILEETADFRHDAETFNTSNEPGVAEWGVSTRGELWSADPRTRPPETGESASNWNI